MGLVTSLALAKRYQVPPATMERCPKLPAPEWRQARLAPEQPQAR
jgi:hypothetical protein